MNKYQVMPQVVVYKNLLNKEDLDRFYKLAVEYQGDMKNFDIVDQERSTREDNHGSDPIERDDDYPINEWVPWYKFGKKTLFNFKKKPDNASEDIKFLHDFRDSVYEMLQSILNDYISEWSDSGYWPEYIDDWSIGSHGNKRLNFSVIEILKHDVLPDKKLAILFHTDSHKHRVGEPRAQQIITITVYVNDDYTGGEVEFLNEIDDEPKVITYKPESGDVTVFPAGIPYWHSAKAVTSGSEKLFARVFALWDYPGSKEWFEGIDKYGKDEWLKIVDEEMQKNVDTGMYDREVRIEGTDWQEIGLAYRIDVKKENHICVDGKDI